MWIKLKVIDATKKNNIWDKKVASDLKQVCELNNADNGILLNSSVALGLLLIHNSLILVFYVALL